MKTLFKINFLTAFLFVSIFAHADINDNLQNYQVKKTVKELLDKEIHSIIKTKLAVDSYQVDIKFDLNPVSADENRDPASADSVSKEDYRLKLFDMQKIITAYKYKQKQVKKDGELPRIKNLELMVGISENYPAKFRSTFQPWLQTVVKNRIGDAKIAFNVIRQPELPKDPEDQKDDEKDKEDLDRLKNEIASLKSKIEDEVFDMNKSFIDKISDVKDDIKDDLEKLDKEQAAARAPASLGDQGLLSHIKDFQQLLSWMLFSFFLFFSLSHFAKNLKPQVELDSTANVNGTQKAVEADSTEKSDADRSEDRNMEEYIENAADSFYDYNTELSSVMMSFAADEYYKLHHLYDFWIANNKEEQKKFWYLMSLCVSRAGESLEFAGFVTTFKEFVAKKGIEWTDDINVSFDKKESDLIESAILADVVRLKAFGEKSFKKALSSLRSVKADKVSRLMAEVGQEDVLFLYLNQEQRDSYLKGLSESKKLILLESAFKNADTEHATVEALEQKVESWIEINRSLDDVKRINLAGKIMKTFGTFTIPEKIKYLDHLKAQSPRAYENLIMTHFHPLWMDRLKERHIGYFLKSLNYKSLLYLYTVNSGIRPYFKTLAAPRVNEMIREENISDVLDKVTFGDPEYANMEKVIKDIVAAHFKENKVDLYNAYNENLLVEAAA